ncbi:MAG: hypothetical protein FD131_767 [Rhodocyclaceae bacterium]|nr:MAG: hypothetical protein FD131_767 [Rhodocyclaceae bacterium]
MVSISAALMVAFGALGTFFDLDGELFGRRSVAGVFLADFIPSWADEFFVERMAGKTTVFLGDFHSCSLVDSKARNRQGGQSSQSEDFLHKILQ